MRNVKPRRWIPACAGMTTACGRRPGAGRGPVSFLLGLALAMQPAYAQDPVAGKVVFNDWCRPCHDVEPRKHPGTAALQFLYKGEKPAALEQRLDLTPDIVSFYVRNGVSIMPFFRKTEIDDRELVDLGAYLSPDNLRTLSP
jgi:mono/diheme cytochrome c family protein